MCSALKGSCEEEGPGVFTSSYERGSDESSFWPGCLLQCFRPAAVPALCTPRAGGSDVAAEKTNTLRLAGGTIR